MDDLAERIAAFIRSQIAGEEEYDALALALFARQYAALKPYRRLCDSYGATPGTVDHWWKIPAAPVSAFKQFALSCASTENISTVFHSSGTTGARTSRHYLDSDAVSLYEISLTEGFHRAVTRNPPSLWALMPAPQTAPNSSLSYMLGTLGAQAFYTGDNAPLIDALRHLNGSITLFGTAFAFASLFDESSDLPPLPEGSLVVETGGFKGRTREIPRAELYRLFEARLGVPQERCYSEYGMCEMASQFYGWGSSEVKRAPHWVRTRIIDPETGDDAPVGRVGILRHFDLANWNSVAAIQTEDLGRTLGDGFELLGRTSRSDLRGCSLTTEEMWSQTRA